MTVVSLVRKCTVYYIENTHTWAGAMVTSCTVDHTPNTHMDARQATFLCQCWESGEKRPREQADSRG